jgi:lipoprotein signal peptidase
MSGVAGHQTKAELGKYVGNINEIESKTYNKVDLLMKTFRVLDMDYTKLAGNGYALTANAWAESPYILQQAGDYYNKGMFLIAKMLKEGSWDAYSAVQDKNGNWKLVYDETLDTRFKQPNGQLLKDFLLQEGLAVDGKLAVGHSTQMIHKIRRLSDEAFGTFTKEDSAIMTNYAGYRFMMIFRRWITDKIDRYMAGRTDNLMEMGEPVKNADGSITWSGSFNEGVFLSIASWMSNMWATRSLAWNTLNEVQKNNIRRMVADASILTLMFAGASALFDAEERKRRKGLYNYVWGTVQDMKLVLFPHTMIHTIQNPSIAFSYINQVMNLLYHMIATPIDAMGINIIDDEQSKKAQKSAFRFLATFVPFLKTYMEITEWDRSIDDIFDGDDSYDFTNEAQVKQRSKDYQTLETYLFD